MLRVILRTHDVHIIIYCVIMIMMSISVHDWRAKWNLSGQFADASYDDIIRDMADIQPHVRLKAIATVGKAAEYKPPSDPGIQIGNLGNPDDPLSVSSKFCVSRYLVLLR